MKIRNADREDLCILLSLYENARKFMKEHGNPNQWGDSYPPEALVKTDIQNGNCYICEEQGEIAAVFFYRFGEDPAYSRIDYGKWLNENPYGVVHRITSSGTVRGAASFCLDWALCQCKNLKIDTHRDNLVMQNLLSKNGFTFCGIIYLEDGSERLAYQKQIENMPAPIF